MKSTERELGGYMRTPEWCHVNRTRPLVPEKYPELIKMSYKCDMDSQTDTHYEANNRFSKSCKCAWKKVNNAECLIRSLLKTRFKNLCALTNCNWKRVFWMRYVKFLDRCNSKFSSALARTPRQIIPRAATPKLSLKVKCIRIVISSHEC